MVDNYFDISDNLLHIVTNTLNYAYEHQSKSGREHGILVMKIDIRLFHV